MAEPSPLSDRELRFLRALNAHGVPFLMVGLSAAALQGAPVVTQDIHLWFDRLDDPSLAAALQQVTRFCGGSKAHRPWAGGHEARSPPRTACYGSTA